MLVTPLFPALRAQLAALGSRTADTLRQLDFPPLGEQLRRLLPTHLLAAEDEGPGSRDRIYGLRLTFECFVWQMLKPNTSSREVVRAVQALFLTLGRGVVAGGTSAYIQARQRLPEERLRRALLATAETADRRVGSQGCFQERAVKVADSSTAQLPDTAENQAAYPQGPGQKPGCGFPLLKFLPIFSLRSGAISHVVTATWKTHDARLLSQAADGLKPGDVLLVDRAFGDFITLATLPQRGVDVVARMHGARKVDFRRPHKRLSREDALFQWRKPYEPSNLLTPGEWVQLPDFITVRVLRFTAVIRGRRARVTLVTTLLDPVGYPAEALIALYRRRWQLQLSLRHLKTTMKMEQLRCQSPDMAQKELLAYLLAYNLIRCLMAEAVAQTGIEMDRISFRGTLDAVRNYAAEIRTLRTKRRRDELWQQLIRALANDPLPFRPGRIEPRAVKRRPKAYALLNKPRKQFKEIRHRSRYRKSQIIKK